MTTKTFAPSIGTRVRELRQERRWTQQRLASLLGITQGYLSLLERGKGSFSANQLFAILKHFNIPIEQLSPEKPSAGEQIQNALARQGARHLLENENILPSKQLKGAIDAIREALVSADSARQVAAVAPVLVNHAGQVNLTRLRDELSKLGLENRLGWAVQSTLEAIKIEAAQELPREWRLKYRRAALIIEGFFKPWQIISTVQDPRNPPPYDILDPEITTDETLKEIIENLSPIAQRWRIATAIEVDDFVRALRGARGAG